jgi:hypothetical protein
MRRLVLHVGMGKTGSSTIQETLAANRAPLERAGICYPRPSWRSSRRTTFRQVNHNLLVGLLQPLEALPREFAAAGDLAAVRRAGTVFWHDVQHQIAQSDAPTVVLSGEYLFYLDAAEMSALRALLAPHFDEIDVVAYVREPASYHLALTQQRLRASPRVRAPADAGYPVRGCLDRLVEAFDGRVKVRAFERDALVGGCVVRDLLTHAVPGGDRLAGSIEVIDVNQAMSAEAMCIMQQFHRVGWGADHDGFTRESYRVLAALDALRDRSPQHPARLRAPIEAGIRRHFGDDLRWMRERFGVSFSTFSMPDGVDGEGHGDPPEGWTSTDVVDVLDVDPAAVDETLHLLVRELAGASRWRGLAEPWRRLRAVSARATR